MSSGTREIAQNLGTAGLAGGAALAVAQAITDLRMSTKAEMVGLRADMREEMASLRTELKTDIAALRTEVKTDVATLRAEFKTDFSTMERRMYMVFCGNVVTVVASIVGLARFLH